MLKIDNQYGNFLLKECYDIDTDQSFYDVFDNKNDVDEVNNIDYIGEFFTPRFFDYEDDEEDKQKFFEEFEDWCDENAVQM